MRAPLFCGAPFFWKPPVNLQNIHKVICIHFAWKKNLFVTSKEHARNVYMDRKLPALGDLIMYMSDFINSL